MAADAKQRSLFFLALALAATLLIGSGLPQLQFQPGMPMPSIVEGRLTAPPQENVPALDMGAALFFKTLVLLIAAAYAIFLIYQMLRGMHWREVLPSIFRVLMVLLVALAVIGFIMILMPRSQIELPAEPMPTPQPLITAPLGPTPALLIWLVGIGLLCLAALLGYSLLATRRNPARPAWELQAELARRALVSGGDLKDIILTCYQRMSQALQEEQQIEREASMTTGEFERLLAAKGLPPAPVHQLTLLFEAVRYGHRQPDAGDEQVALRSLDAILSHARASAHEG